MVPISFRRRDAVRPLLLLAFFSASVPVSAQAVTFAGAQVAVAATGLNAPYGIAADAAGDVFIADSNNNRVLKIPVGGSPQASIGSGFKAPQGVTVDAAGNVFVADTGNTRIVELPAGGGAQTVLASGLTDPIGIAVDKSDNVWVADYGDGLVEIPLGGSATPLGGLFELYINSVAVDASGNIFVSNTLSFNSDPEIFGYNLPPATQEIPTGCVVYVCVSTLDYTPAALGVAVDASDNVYIALPGAVTEYSTSAGKSLGTVGTGIGDATGVAVDPRGDIYISDGGKNDALEVQNVAVNFGNLALGATGETVTLNYNINSAVTLTAQNVLSLGGSSGDFSLASGSTCTGALAKGSTCVVKATFAPIASGMRTGAVQLVDTSDVASGIVATTLLTGTGLGPEIAFSGSVQNNFINSLGGADGIAVEGKGDIIIADTFNNRVVNLPPKGALTTIGVNLCEPAGVAVDGGGDVFIADFCNNRVVEVPADGGAQLTIGSGFSGPKDVAVDGMGDVFVADTLNNRVVEVINGGAQIVLNANAGGTALNSPTGVAVNAEGDVLIADTGNNRVVMVQTNGTMKTLGTGFNQPTGVAIDGAGLDAKSQPGDVFVADYGNNRVVEIPADTHSPQFTIGTGYVGPHGVAVDAAGDLFVVDRNDANAYSFMLSAPPSISFPTSTPVDQLDKTDGNMSVTALNIGNEPLTFATPTFPSNFPTRAPAAGQECNNGLQLEPGQNCVVTAGFDPTSVGANTASIVLNDNALNIAGAAQSISASGTGIQDTQTITFAPTVTSYPFTAGTFQVSATASSALAVTFASTTPTFCTVASPTSARLRAMIAQTVSLPWTVSIVSAGSCIIEASQPGDTDHSAATPVSVTFTITKGVQTITFNPSLTTFSYAIRSFSLSASSTSNLPVSFASTTPAVCGVTGTLATLNAGGVCTIQATQSGNVDYAAATPVPVSFTITPIGQTITFPAITASEHAASKLALSATASSKLPVTFTSKTTKVCTVSKGVATLLIEGTCTIEATQRGNATYTAAAEVTRSFTVHLASQKITFPAVKTPVDAGTEVKLGATASSKLPVKYTSETLTVCTVAGSEASLLKAGTCTIKATQAGNDVYAAAPAVTDTFTVSQ